MVEVAAERHTDFVASADAIILHVPSVIDMLRATQRVGEFKIVQHVKEHLQVLVVPNDRVDQQGREHITAGLRMRFGSHCGWRSARWSVSPPTARASTGNWSRGQTG